MLWRRPGQTPTSGIATGGDGVHLSLPELIGLRGQSGQLLSRQTRLSAGHLHGQHSSRFRGRGMDFDEVRPYQDGDDVRSIDWRVTARTGRAHTKLYREERERPIHIILDQSDSLFFGTRQALKAVTAARASALLTWAGLAADQRVGALLFGRHDHLELKPSSNRRQIAAMLRQIAERHNAHVPFLLAADRRHESTAALAALRRLRHVLRPGSLVFVLSDFHAFDATVRLELGNIARHAETTAFFLNDPLERELPRAGDYGFCNGEEVLRLDTGERGLRDRYAAAYRQRRDELARFCASQGIAFHDLGTEQPLARTLGDALANSRSAA